MKKAIALFLVLLMTATLLSACGEFTVRVSKNDTVKVAKLGESSVEKKLSEHTMETFVEIMKDKKVTDGPTNCEYDYKITVNEQVYLFCDCGNVMVIGEGKTFNLSEEETAKLLEICK